MRDFPLFTTEYGAASLVLKEIPYRGVAYVTILDSQEPEKLLEECVSFCRVCGGEQIYSKGHPMLEKYPLHCAVVEMRGTARPEQVESLFPVTEQTVARWRAIYNEKMAAVDNAAYLEVRDEKKIIDSRGAYFVHREGALLGIGWLEEEKLLAVAAAAPGLGTRVMQTLMSLLEGQQLVLEVASTNQRAIRLYEKLGFVKTREISRWYRVV